MLFFLLGERYIEKNRIYVKNMIPSGDYKMTGGGGGPK